MKNYIEISPSVRICALFIKKLYKEFISFFFNIKFDSGRETLDKILILFAQNFHEILAALKYEADYVLKLYARRN